MCALGFIWYSRCSGAISEPEYFKPQQGSAAGSTRWAGVRSAVSALSRCAASGQRTEANLRSAGSLLKDSITEGGIGSE